MTKVEQVLALIPPEDMHFVEEWKNGTGGFHEAAKEWLKTKDPVKDDAEIASAMAHAVGMARKHTALSYYPGMPDYEEGGKMEKRNLAFTAKCSELGLW